MTERITELAQALEERKSASNSALREQQEAEKLLLEEQARLVGWHLENPYAQYAASVLVFAEENSLDPVWLGGMVSKARFDVKFTRRGSRSLIDHPQTSQELYQQGINLLCQDHWSDGPFLNAARDTFALASEKAAKEEGINANQDPQTKRSFFYQYLAQHFSGVLKRFVHDDHWENY